MKPRTREVVADLMEVAKVRPLSPGQRRLAHCIAEEYDVHVPDVAAPNTSAQPWGPLPKAPPGRRT